LKNKFVTYGTYFIHMRNIVAEHKMTNFANNRWCQNRRLKTNTSTQLYTFYENGCKYQHTIKRPTQRNEKNWQRIQ